jgi:hypothetical protein
MRQDVFKQPLIEKEFSHSTSHPFFLTFVHSQQTGIFSGSLEVGRKMVLPLGYRRNYQVPGGTVGVLTPK